MFMNPDRVTNADIDTDYGGEDRDKVKYFLLHDHLNLPQIQSSEIITFNTIALKGAIRDVARALYKKDDDDKQYLEIANYICDNVDSNEKKMRKEYPDLFDYVDIVNGVIVSVGSHPSGVLVTDREIAEEVGLCTTSGSDYPISMLNMKELDALMYVKLDILGLDNMAVINETCKLAGIERATPDNIPLDDMNVWESIRDDTTMIFQFESASAQAYLRRLFSDATIKMAKERNPNFSMIKWLSFGNGLIRPSCASFRDDVAQGHAVTNGMKELDEFLSDTLGHIAMQEDIMQFLVKFCGYSNAESDNVRRCIDENTLITMADSTLKRIKDIKVGDVVASFDDSAITKSVVTNVFDNGFAECLKVKTVHGNEVICTPQHKFLTNIGWKRAADISENDIIMIPSKTVGCIPVGIASIEPSGEHHVYDIEVGDTHNYVANGLIAHNCIAKKYGTEQVLPEIRERFIKYSMDTFHYDKELCEKVIDPFLQVILDASSYGFSWNHSDAYSCIGYICGYLRYYYPLEFTASALNVFSDNEEKTAAIINYAIQHRISLSPAKFGKSRSGYMIDSACKTIYKGLESVKYLNSAASEFLYSLRENHYDTFMDLLMDIANNPALNARQLDVLIKIDFFSDFGNIRELSEIVHVFDFMKQGNAKSIAKAKVDGTWMEPLIQPYVESVGKNGNALKSYRVVDMPSILKACTQKIMSAGLSDVPFKTKIQNQKDYLGYVDLTTNKQEDRRKLFIMDLRSMTSKSGAHAGDVWGYAVFTRSIGSGKQGRFTIRIDLYNKMPITKGQVIYVDEYWTNKSGYHYLDRYHVIEN